LIFYRHEQEKHHLFGYRQPEADHGAMTKIGVRKPALRHTTRAWQIIWPAPVLYRFSERFCSIRNDWLRWWM